MTRCFRDVLPAELPSIFAALLTTASADAGSIQSNDSVGLGRPAALWYSRHLSGYGFNNPLTGSRKRLQSGIDGCAPGCPGTSSAAGAYPRGQAQELRSRYGIGPWQYRI